MFKWIDRLLDALDVRKKNKALQVYPWCYEDRHGRQWFNTDYCCGFLRFRKWC